MISHYIALTLIVIALIFGTVAILGLLYFLFFVVLNPEEAKHLGQAP